MLLDRSGVGGYSDYLDASRTLLDIESALAGSEHGLALARLALHRALGGAWTAPQTAAEAPPELSPSARAMPRMTRSSR